MFFDPTRHEALTTNFWDQNTVSSEISSIIKDIENSFLADASWPTHAMDAESYSNDGPKWAAYAGAAGTIHALQILKGYGLNARDLSKNLESIYQSFLVSPDVTVEPGLQLGEIGILLPLVLAQLENQELATRLKICMQATLDLPLYEITSGQTGMMHVALALYNKTGASCWKELFVKGAQSLMEHWLQDETTGEWLWQSQVFGPKRHYYGACHGVAGNANVLLQGIDLLPHGYQETIIERTLITLELSAQQDEHFANWPLCTKPNIDKLLVQWCHGAAGIVTALARTPKSEDSQTEPSQTEPSQTERLDQLLVKTGELIWQAGPLNKGSNICHGTAGNGYAFLYLFQRWSDQIWLDRARQFAMHAIEQRRNARSKYDQGRYTLWTGDAGLAVYLYHCIYPDKAAIPGLDLF
ncbi:MAG: LanC-like protein [Kangiellaceae bacterium]|nr:LanC-like protein [Kangiellaceae bacterium]